MTNLRNMALGGTIIFLATIAAYLPAMRGPFLWDDDFLITDNPIIKARDGLRRFWFTAEAPDYYPISESLLWCEWRVWGKNAFGYRAVNLLLHATNAVLLGTVLRQLKVPGAWIAGLVFAIHPVNVANVAWPNQQKTTLSMLLCALSILFYLGFERGQGRWAYGASVIMFLLALLSKTAVAMFPIAILACIWWMRGRLRLKDVLLVTPFWLLSLILGLVTVWFQHYRALEGRVIRPDAVLVRIATAGTLPWFYLYKAMLPLNLSLIYPQWNLHRVVWFAWLPGLVLLSLFFLFWHRRHTWGRSLLFGMGYFVVMLLPVLGFIDQGFYTYSMVADHWQYYSIVGVIGLVVGAGTTLYRRAEGNTRICETIVAVVVLLVLAIASWSRAALYGNAEALWQDTLAKNPRCWLAHDQLGIILQRQSQTRLALEHFQQALQLNPSYVNARNNLAGALLQLGKASEAAAECLEVLRARPNNIIAHNNLSVAYLQLNRAADAIAQSDIVLRSDPDDADAHANRGVANYRLGKFSEAIVEFQRALDSRPDSAELHFGLGMILAQRNEINEAVGQLEQAVRLKPNDAQLHYWFANSLVKAGRTADATLEYERTLQINPTLAEAHNDLAMILAQSGKRDEAIQHWERAIAIRPDYAEARANLLRAKASQ